MTKLSKRNQKKYKYLSQRLNKSIKMSMKQFKQNKKDASIARGWAP